MPLIRDDPGTPTIESEVIRLTTSDDMVVSVTIRLFIGEAFEGIDPQKSREKQERKEQI